jgi:hypothetical protein
MDERVHYLVRCAGERDRLLRSCAVSNADPIVVLGRRLMHHDRNTDRALQLLTRLAARGSVWPAACGMAIRDLRSTLDENRRDKLTGGKDFPNGSSHSGERPESSTTEYSAPARPPGTDAYAVESVSPGSGVSSQPSKDAPKPPTNRPLQATASSNPPTQATAYPEPLAGGSWLDLGMDLEGDLPMFPSDGLDPLQGFDIPFWMGADNYTTYMGS